MKTMWCITAGLSVPTVFFKPDTWFIYNPPPKKQKQTNNKKYVLFPHSAIPTEAAADGKSDADVSVTWRLDDKDNNLYL